MLDRMEPPSLPLHDPPCRNMTPFGIFTALELEASVEAGCQHCVILHEALLCFSYIPRSKVHFTTLKGRNISATEIGTGRHWSIQIFTADGEYYHYGLI